MEDVKINKVTRFSSPLKTVSGKEKIVVETSGEVKGKDADKNEFKTRKRISITPRAHKKKFVRGLLKYLFFITTTLGVVFWIGFLFRNAQVEISVKRQNFEYKTKIFNASRTPRNNDVDFEIMIESDKKYKDYILTESKEVATKATGSIILYNEFSIKPEKLSSGTYVSDQKGRTYRLDNNVVIPGYKMNGQNKIAGQTEVGITSFLAGENYNGKPDKFYINSFKGSTKSNKIYGELKEELLGGVQGLVYYLTDQDKDHLKQTFSSSLKEELLNKIKALLPAGYILYPGATKFFFEINEITMSNTPETKIPVDVKLSAVLIKEDSLIRSIIKQSLLEIEENEVSRITLKGVNNLEFKFTEDQQINKDTGSFFFTLNGPIESIWNPNKEILRNELLGAHKNEVLSIFSQDKGITKAMVRVFPPWDKYLPYNPLRIKINVD